MMTQRMSHDACRRMTHTPHTHARTHTHTSHTHTHTPHTTAFALISDYVSNADPGIRSGAILGLGLAYAGTLREEVQELLVPLVSVEGCWVSRAPCVLMWGKGGWPTQERRVGDTCCCAVYI
jgi:hypothetical protein